MGDGNRKTPIEIIRIGGDALSFSLHDNWAIGIPIGKPLKVKILFEEYDIDITGSILKSYDFGPINISTFIIPIYQIQKGMPYIGNYLESKLNCGKPYLNIEYD